VKRLLEIVDVQLFMLAPHGAWRILGVAGGFLMATVIIYHVSNVPASSPAPQWTHVQPSLLRDQTYDGPMVGLETAAFSSTLINGKMPRRTTYPTRAAAGTKWWRTAFTFDPRGQRMFLMHEYTTKESGVRQVQLLCCSIADPAESDFAVALATIGFRELQPPHYNDFLPNGRGNSFDNTMWVNLHFLAYVPVMGGAASWRKVAKMGDTGAGQLVALKAVPGKVAMMSKWLEKYHTPVFPRGFSKGARAEPSLKDVERNREAAAVLADLEPLYRFCAALLRDKGVDVENASAKKLSEALKGRTDPYCIGCLHSYPHAELAKHLHKNRGHVYSLEQLHKEKELVLRKVRDGSREAQKVRVIFAIKTASLINLGHKKK
jgi:hypothetical protein